MFAAINQNTQGVKCHVNAFFSSFFLKLGQDNTKRSCLASSVFWFVFLNASWDKCSVFDFSLTQRRKNPGKNPLNADLAPWRQLINKQTWKQKFAVWCYRRLSWSCKLRSLPCIPYDSIQLTHRLLFLQHIARYDAHSTAKVTLGWFTT